MGDEGDILDIFHVFQPNIDMSLSFLWAFSGTHEQTAVAHTHIVGRRQVSSESGRSRMCIRPPRSIVLCVTSHVASLDVLISHVQKRVSCSQCPFTSRRPVAEDTGAKCVTYLVPPILVPTVRGTRGPTTYSGNHRASNPQTSRIPNHTRVHDVERSAKHVITFSRIYTMALTLTLLRPVRLTQPYYSFSGPGEFNICCDMNANLVPTFCQIGLTPLGVCHRFASELCSGNTSISFFFYFRRGRAFRGPQLSGSWLLLRGRRFS